MRTKETRDLAHLTIHLPPAVAAMLVVLMQRSGESQAVFNEPEMDEAAALIDAGKVLAHFQPTADGTRIELLTIEILK